MSSKDKFFYYAIDSKGMIVRGFDDFSKAIEFINSSTDSFGTSNFDLRSFNVSLFSEKIISSFKSSVSQIKECLEEYNEEEL